MTRGAVIALVLAGLLGGGLLLLRGAPPPETGPGGIEVPSGQAVTLLEVIRGQRGPAGLTVRYRFVAPGISKEGGKVDFDAAVKDMQHLCESYAIPRIATTGPQPAQIIISLADRPFEFGTANPSATQYFEAYRVENSSCIWEAF